MGNKAITVLVDNDSWILPYAHQLVKTLRNEGYEAYFVQNPDAVGHGWINFMLGCTRIVNSEVLSRNSHNLVVHESDLPQGRGFAPMAWQILDGKNNIHICLIEATECVDAGDIWLRDIIRLDGTELCDEWRSIQGSKTLDLCLRFVKDYDSLQPTKQQGTASWHGRRTPANSRLNLESSIREQFQLLRIVDNDRYPAYFEINGQKYTLKIEKE